ncbi:hypothetical protein BYT27DRAFT_7252376 [Phlegmacium glaucopus]|nr:hypothetical protein BYT27DRAFT_7252376 [Phlegmacium glaucopus]
MLSAPHNNQLSRRNTIVWVPTRPRNSGEVRRTFPPPAPASTSAASTSTALTSAVPISTPATAEIYRQGQCQAKVYDDDSYFHQVSPGSKTD